MSFHQDSFHQPDYKLVQLYRKLGNAMRSYIEYQVDAQGLEYMNMIKRSVTELLDNTVEDVE